MSKLEAYKLGLYRFRAPPVCTAYWEVEDWIAFIDAGKSWTVEVV